MVIPSFNQAEFIERTLISILNQNYANLEIIVIDGGSSDGTTKILDRYREELAYVHSTEDQGQSDALNQGFLKATGDIFAWLNSDDLYLPGTIDAVVKAFETSPGASVVFGDWWSVDSEDHVTEVSYAFDFSLGHFIYEGFHLNSQAMFWRREAHHRFGEFDADLHRTMDYDLILRLGLKEGEDKFVRLPRALACFRRHPGQKTTESCQDVVSTEHHLIAKKNGLAWKYTVIGSILRCFYRGRRGWWYLKRGGLAYIFFKLLGRS